MDKELPLDELSDLSGSSREKKKTGITSRISVSKREPNGSPKRTNEAATPAFLREFFIPVHGFILFSDEEVEIIRHPSIQRLRGVYQLGQTHYVYPGATHTRFEHVLGTVHVAQKIADSIELNYKLSKRKGLSDSHDHWQLDEPLNKTELAFIRIAALLHDIGHLPAGHTLEDELGLLDKHDKKKRIDRISNEPKWSGRTISETLKERINAQYSKFIPSDYDVSPYDLVLSIILKKDESVLNQSSLNGLVRLNACRDIVGNTICADLLDYLYRDWYHIGKPLPNESRLYQYMQIRTSKASDDASEPTHNFLIWVGEEPNIKSDAFSSILSLLEKRYELAEAVLFHKTKCLATAMLERGLLELYSNLIGGDEEGVENLVTELLSKTDNSMLDHFRETAGEDVALSNLFANLSNRHLYKNLFSHRSQQRGPGADEKILRVYCAAGTAGAKNRLTALRLLEREFGLPNCSLAMYCPSRKMNAKVAEVQVCIDDSVTVLSQLTGREFGVQSHLAAQIERFRTLWKLQIGIDQDVLKELDQKKLECLQLAIERVVLGIGTPSEIKSSSYDVAKYLTTDKASPYFGKTPIRETVAARGTDLQKCESYPSSHYTFSRFYETLEG